MLIKITVLDETTNQKLDIQIDNEQRIITTLRVLTENIEGFSLLYNIEHVRIQETGRRIEVKKTYEESDIYTGTTLIIESNEINENKGEAYANER